MNLTCYTPSNRLTRALFPDLSILPGLQAHEGPVTRFGEDKDNHYVQIDLPGVRKEDLNVQVEGNQLLVVANRQVGFNGNNHNQTYRRVFALPDEVQLEAIKADHKDGVLTLSLPKREEVKPKTISVNVN